MIVYGVVMLHINVNGESLSRQRDDNNQKKGERTRLSDLKSLCCFFSLRVCERNNGYQSENYYMEREWRMIVNLQFNISDVRRVFLLERYVVNFRKDVPAYCGQLNFV
jgi:hypothetical protein